MSKDFKLILATIFMALWFGFLLGSLTHAEQVGQVSEQFVFHVDHETGRPGEYVIEPKEVRIAYNILPLDGTHPAPLSPDSLMLCRQYSEDMKLYLRCGADRYRVVALGLLPRKAKNDAPLN